jgi:hypothetical protein
MSTNKGDFMLRIQLPVEASNVGVTENDVKCMLKAIDKDMRFYDVYAPSLHEVAKLVDDAYKAEYQRSRHVDKWVNLVLKFEALLK